MTGKQFDRLLLMQGTVCILLASLCLVVFLFHRGFRNDVDERIAGLSSVPIEVVQLILDESDVTPYVAVPSFSVGFLGTGWLLFRLRKRRQSLTSV